MLAALKKDLKAVATKKRALASAWFFKTGPGQYGEGDVFIGVPVPDMRRVAKKYRDLSLSDIQKLLGSKIHEHRLTALFILVYSYESLSSRPKRSAVEGSLDSTRDDKKKKIVDFYLRNTTRVNNWDLVDSSAHKILGAWLLTRPKERKILYTLAKSNNLWERRIAIIATLAFINHDDFADTLKIAKIQLHDEHDLMHKAVGWMLREVGKRDMKPEEDFLEKHHKGMPRTMLRYAIEKFPESKRKYYMKK